MTNGQIILAKMEGCRKLIEELKRELEEIRKRLEELEGWQEVEKN